MPKLHLSTDITNEFGHIVQYAFYCPGCKNAHIVRTSGPRPCWEYNGNVDFPTFSPSIFVGPGTKFQCHSFVKDGKIQFLGDCYHELKNQTVDIPEWESTKYEFDNFD